MAGRRGRIDLVGKHEERFQQRIQHERLQRTIRAVRREQYFDRAAEEFDEDESK